MLFTIIHGGMNGRYESDLESHWIFDTSAKGTGQLETRDEGAKRGGQVFQ